jgi:transposase
MIKNAKWALGSGLQLLGSECHDGCWTVLALGQGSARCPVCDVQSTRRHGWQVRRLQDLPAQGTPVTLRVRLARWRCQNQGCERRTFSDRLPDVARPSARRTCRVADLTRLFGHAAGGRPAERLMASLDCRRAMTRSCAVSSVIPAHTMKQRRCGWSGLMTGPGGRGLATGRSWSTSSSARSSMCCPTARSRPRADGWVAFWC